MGPNWRSIYFSGNGCMLVDVVAERAMVPWWWHFWKLRYHSNGSLSLVWAVGLPRRLLKELDLGKRNKLFFEVACFWPSDLLIAMSLSSVLKWEEMGGFLMGGEPDLLSLTAQEKNSFWDVMTISDILHIMCCPRGVFKETRKWLMGVASLVILLVNFFHFFGCLASHLLNMIH